MHNLKASFLIFSNKILAKILGLGPYKSPNLNDPRIRWVRPTPDRRDVMEQPDWEARCQGMGPEEALSHIKDHAQGIVKLSREQAIFCYKAMQRKFNPVTKRWEDQP